MNVELDAGELELLIAAVIREVERLAKAPPEPLRIRATMDLHRRLIVAYEQALYAGGDSPMISNA